jgi:hypothetical protein
MITFWGHPGDPAISACITRFFSVQSLFGPDYLLLLLLLVLFLSPLFPQVFTITVPAGQVEAMQCVVLQQLTPNARLTYSVGGTLKYELPTAEVCHISWIVLACFALA